KRIDRARQEDGDAVIILRERSHNVHADSKVEGQLIGGAEGIGKIIALVILPLRVERRPGHASTRRSSEQIRGEGISGIPRTQRIRGGKYVGEIKTSGRGVALDEVPVVTACLAAELQRVTAQDFRDASIERIVIVDAPYEHAAEPGESSDG